jgi:hypothetical protein
LYQDHTAFELLKIPIKIPAKNVIAEMVLDSHATIILLKVQQLCKTKITI